jgi:hypothetical protein
VVAPPVTGRFDHAAYLFPDGKPRTVRLVVTSADSAIQGTARLRLPSGWTATPAQSSFTLRPRGEQSIDFEVKPASGPPVTETMTAELETGGATWSRRRVEIDHPHIPIQLLFPSLEAKLVRADVRHGGERIAYLMGSGDQVPEALTQMGFQVTLLGDDEVERGDLSRFDAIVTGVRAYNTRKPLRLLHPKLMEYVKNGGTLVVQYNSTSPQPLLIKSPGPYPFTVSNERVTVEEAPVTLLKPEHPLLNVPNKIRSEDWNGWVQERGLYFTKDWDPQYETLIATNDPNEPSKPGGELFARVGKGVFIYTSYAWFRQLPAGVPGAYRLFVNLVSAR